ncbi:MAG: cadherin-like beta sandwich domain-containing protein [Bacilli bacterium]|nr:cadherin-like beta sandwich domain-containing protein [Bacilli bacterium]
MKKVLNILLTLFISLSFTSVVNAASATISVSSSSNQVIVGKDVTVYVTVSSAAALGSWEYTLNYDSSVFKLQSSDVGVHYAAYASNGNTKSVQYKYVFKALKSGSSKFYIDSSMVVDWDERILGVNDGSKTIKTLTYSEYQASLSSNNNLSNLTVEGYEITPEFSKDVLEYSVKVNEDETKVKINATAEDKTATISGAGEVEVSAGSNSFDIVVIAQNGSEKTYKLNVEVIDKNPINVEVDGKKYTVVKIASNLTKPESYVEKNLVIQEFDIPGFYSEVTEFNLVGLKDEEGNVSLFIYENDTYKKYIELSFGGISIYPMEMKESLESYERTTIKIQEADIEVLTLNENSRFKLIYGLNVETKEQGLYLYDTKDQTIMKYDEEYIKMLEEKNTMLTYSTLAFVVSTVLALFGIIGLSKKGNKSK